MALPGIDVAQFQKGIDWNAVAQANHFAIAKATEGVGFTDPLWGQFSQVLSSPGPLVPGAYHFARPDLGNTAVGEADWFSSVVHDFVVKCRQQPEGVLLVLDLEQGSLGDLSGWRDAFCNRVQSNLGSACGWYSFWNFCLNHGLNVASPFWAWFAWPDSNGAMPVTAFQVVMQQYGAGPQGGVNCDLDRFFGDRIQLLALANSAAFSGSVVTGGFHLDYSLKLALVGLMYFGVLGRGPKDQPEADQWAAQIGDQGQNAWQVLQAIAATPEAQAYATPAGRLAAAEAAIKGLTKAPVGQHTHSLTGTTGAPQ